MRTSSLILLLPESTCALRARLRMKIVRAFGTLWADGRSRREVGPFLCCELEPESDPGVPRAWLIDAPAMEST